MSNFRVHAYQDTFNQTNTGRTKILDALRLGGGGVCVWGGGATSIFLWRECAAGTSMTSTFHIKAKPEKHTYSYNLTQKHTLFVICNLNHFKVHVKRLWFFCVAPCPNYPYVLIQFETANPTFYRTKFPRKLTLF